jgi:hypothetical protein
MTSEPTQQEGDSMTTQNNDLIKRIDGLLDDIASKQVGIMQKLLDNDNFKFEEPHRRLMQKSRDKVRNLINSEALALLDRLERELVVGKGYGELVVSIHNGIENEKSKYAGE